MGCVYRAVQTPLGRPVAVKVLSSFGGDPEFRQRFLLEASTSARLTHPHIVTVFDYGESESGDLYMVMELLDGVPLSSLLAKAEPLAPARALAIGLQVARALRTAHRAGVVHRDLKPSNVMLLEDVDAPEQRDFVKVLDFGLAKVKRAEPAEWDAELTRSGTILGSPRYMAPEQIRSRPVDGRADVYALGVLLFHALVGRPPFGGPASVDIMNDHLHTPAPRLAEVAPHLASTGLDELVARCLAKKPDNRFDGMEALIDALLEAGKSIEASQLLDPSGRIATGRRASHVRPPSERPVRPSLMALLGAVAIAALWWTGEPTHAGAHRPAIATLPPPPEPLVWEEPDIVPEVEVVPEPSPQPTPTPSAPSSLPADTTVEEPIVPASRPARSAPALVVDGADDGLSVPIVD